jgi:hypothetical protein
MDTRNLHKLFQSKPREAAAADYPEAKLSWSIGHQRAIANLLPTEVDKKPNNLSPIEQMTSANASIWSSAKNRPECLGVFADSAAS